MLVSGSATVAVAVEGGWFATIDELERAELDAADEAREARERAGELDEYLEATITDRETARGATEKMRRDIAAGVADWDAAMRRAERLKWTEGPDVGHRHRRLLESTGAPADDGWRRNVELLVEVEAGLDHMAALLVRRGQVDVEHAYAQAQSKKAEGEREEVTDAAADADEELEREIEKLSEELAAKFARLNPLPSDGDFHRNKGALIPPVNAEPDHPFGPRQRRDSFTEVRHTGVTYVIGEGTTVRSVGDGTVVEVDRLPGFGKTVIVDHGNEYHSLYAHLSTSDVEEGDEIEERATIGRSGESGSLEGPKLYFELRRQGHPIDPEEWFVSD